MRTKSETGASNTPSRVTTGGEKSGTASAYSGRTFSRTITKWTALRALGLAASTSMSTPAVCRNSKPKGRTASASLSRSRRSTARSMSRVIRAASGSHSEMCRNTAMPPTTRCSMPAARKAVLMRFNTWKSCSTCWSYAVAEITRYCFSIRRYGTGLWGWQAKAPAPLWVGSNALLHYHGLAREGELAAYFIHYVELADVVAGRQGLQRDLHVHRNGVRARRRYCRRRDRAGFEGLLAFLVEQAHGHGYFPGG